jgi:uncharacterized secreted protein with C-terminal beta-propeller domain
MKQIFKIRLAVLLVLGSLIFSGCATPFGLPKQSPTPIKPNQPNENSTGNIPEEIKVASDNQSKIKKFKDYDELASFLEDGPSVASYGGFGINGGVRNLAGAEVMMKSAVPTAAMDSVGLSAPAKEESAQAGSGDFSKTNIQVEGVDESDIIKSDGKDVYAVSNNSLYIISAYPAEKAEVVSKIEFESRPQDIYISGDRLAIFGNNQIIYNSNTYRNFRRQSSYTFLKVFDISDKKNPKQVRDLDFEGNYFDSRLIGDHLYFVTNNYNYYYATSDPVIPRLLENGEVLPIKCEGKVKCFAPEVYYFDIPYDSYNFTQVASINLKKSDEAVQGDVYVLSGGQNMYVSQDNVYIAYTKYLSEYQLSMSVLKEMIVPKLTAPLQEKVKEIEATKNYILNEQEKMAKIAAIVERYMASLSSEDQSNLEKDLEQKMKNRYKDISKELEKTVIHKIGDGKQLHPFIQTQNIEIDPAGLGIDRIGKSVFRTKGFGVQRLDLFEILDHRLRGIS